MIAPAYRMPRPRRRLGKLDRMLCSRIRQLTCEQRLPDNVREKIVRKVRAGK